MVGMIFVLFVLDNWCLCIFYYICSGLLGSFDLVFIYL